MADVNNGRDFEDVTQGDQKERKRRPKRVLPKPLLRLLVILAVVIVVIVVIVVAVTSANKSSEAADYQQYMSSVDDLLKQSDSIGGELTKLLTNPGDTNRKDIQTKLDQYVSKSADLEAKAKELQVPKDLLDQNVHQFFVLAMTFRHTGLADLEPSLMNALEVQDTDVAAEQISRALYYLTNSDFLYKEVFIPKATEIVKEKNLTGVTVPDSQFVSDPDLASRTQAQEIIAQLKSTGNLQAVHGVALVKVVEQPDEQQIKNGQTYNLTSSDQLVFLVTVENQGNMAEKDVPVVVKLSTQSGEPQEITVTIPELKPGAQATATVQGLNPTTYGEVAALAVNVGPVAGEKVMTNNSLKANVIFKL
jgi:CARDB